MIGTICTLELAMAEQRGSTVTLGKSASLPGSGSSHIWGHETLLL